MSETATFAAGCFWGVEAAFREIGGVLSTTVGYTGGHTADPTYEQVCTGTTGHAEAVQIEYDPEVVTYPELLQVFWFCHDPAQLNRQGPDVGTQYRSAIFYHDERQAEQAHASMQERQVQIDFTIVTQIEAVTRFYPAEEYHQQYFEKRGIN
jgi:peptide-methionine (S)-S-oxide reductase